MKLNKTVKTTIKSFDATGCFQGGDISMAEFAIVSFSPGKYSTISGES
jgi:hypothetical protein